MASSSKDILNLVPSGKKAPKVSAEKIDERILRLLGIEAFEVEMDYDTYKDALREFMSRGRASKTEIPTDEVERVTNEWKRVKSKKGRFKTKVKKIKVENIKSGGGVGVGVKTTTVSAQKLLPGTAEKKNPFQGIKDSLDNIAEHFRERNKFDKKQSEEEQKAAKKSRRAKLLGGLKKGVGVIAKAADKILTPVKNVFQRILEFFIKIFLARALIKLLGWFSNPQNKKKIDAIFRFLGDHWPKLLTLYLAFGTGLGRFSVWIIKKLSWGAARLIAAAASVVAAKGGKGAAGWIAKMIPGQGSGKWVKALVQTAAVGGTMMAVSGGIEGMAGGGDPGPPPTEYASGGLVKVPAFSGGGLFSGLGNIFGGMGDMFGGMGKGGKMMGGAALGGLLFGPLGMLLGAGLGGSMGKDKKPEGGFVSGPGGVDKVPARLTAGEFVMSKGAVDKYGVAQMEAMNAAGGGTNKPTMKSGTVFAAGGGEIGADSSTGGTGPGPRSSSDTSSSETNQNQKHPNDGTLGKNKNKMIFLHWSAGNRQGTRPVEGKWGYQGVIPSSGKPVYNAKYGSTSAPYHTYGRNKSNAAGIGVAGMAGSSEQNFKNWGTQAITSTQWQGMAKEAARLATSWGWSAGDINNKHVRTHSEEYRDKPNWYRRNVSTDYRWDLDRLYPQKSKGSGPDEMRNMIKRFMGSGNLGVGDPDATTDYEGAYTGPDSATGVGPGPQGGPSEPTGRKASPPSGTGSSGSARTQERRLKYGDDPTETKSERQARLNAMSFAGKGTILSGATATSDRKISKGKRIDAEEAKRQELWEGSGGRAGAFGRWWKKNFGGAQEREAVAKYEEDVRRQVKQSGAESINRYYEPRDGKYYLNKEAADKALAKTDHQKTKATPPSPPVSPGTQARSEFQKALEARKAGSVTEVRTGGPKDKSQELPVFNAGSNSKTKNRVAVSLGIAG